MTNLVEESMKHLSTKSTVLTEGTYVVVHPGTGVHNEFSKVIDAKKEIDKIIGPAGSINLSGTSKEVNIRDLAYTYDKIKPGVRHAVQIKSTTGSTLRLVTYKK